MRGYELELEGVADKVRESGASRVGLQFPEGLKTLALEVADYVRENTRACVVVLCDPCYGACDTRPNQCESLGIDLLIHFGHTEFVP